MVNYPEVFTAGVRKDTRQLAKKLLSMQVMAFNWLFLNKPENARACLRLVCELSAIQWSAVRMLEHLPLDGNTPNSVIAGDMWRLLEKWMALKSASRQCHGR